MPVIRRSTKAGHRAPSVITGINWASPLAQGLRFLVSFNSATPRELVTGSAVIANGSPTHVKRPKGGATDLDGSDFWSIADNDGFDITEELTLAWAGRIDTGSANRHFVGKHLSNGGAANPFDFRTGSEANPKLHLVRANTTHRWWVGNSSPIILGADHVHTLSMSAAMEVSPVAYTDGVVPSTFTAHSGGGGTGPATGNSADLRIGRRPDGTVQMDGAVYFVAGWAREFGIGEHIAFGLNPYDLFLTNPRTYDLGTPAAATSGPTVITKPKTSGPLFRGDEHLRINRKTDMGDLDFGFCVMSNGQEIAVTPTGLVESVASVHDGTAVQTRLGLGTSAVSDNRSYYTGATLNLDNSKTAVMVFSDVDVTGVAIGVGSGMAGYTLSEYNATEKMGYSISGVANNASSLDGPRGESGVALWGVTRGGTLTTALNGRTGTEGSISASGANSESGPVYLDGIRGGGTRHLLLNFEGRWSDAELQWYSETPRRIYDLMFGKTTRKIFLPGAAAAAATGTGQTVLRRPL